MATQKTDRTSSNPYATVPTEMPFMPTKISALGGFMGNNPTYAPIMNAMLQAMQMEQNRLLPGQQAAVQASNQANAAFHEREAQRKSMDNFISTLGEDAGPLLSLLIGQQGTLEGPLQPLVADLLTQDYNQTQGERKLEGFKDLGAGYKDLASAGYDTTLQPDALAAAGTTGPLGRQTPTSVRAAEQSGGATITYDGFSGRNPFRVKTNDPQEALRLGREMQQGENTDPSGVLANLPPEIQQQAEEQAKALVQQYRRQNPGKDIRVFWEPSSTTGEEVLRVRVDGVLIDKEFPLDTLLQAR